MSGTNFYYFCSQLPTLLPGGHAPLAPREFDRDAAGLLGDDAARYLAECARLGDRGAQLPAGSVGAEFHTWDFALRGEIARLRLAARGADQGGGAYQLPPETDSFAGLKEAVAQADGAANPWERERRIDRLRWRKLDELEAGRQFTLEYVACYRIKLALLYKHDGFTEDDGRANFEAAATQIDRHSAE